MIKGNFQPPISHAEHKVSAFHVCLALAAITLVISELSRIYFLDQEFSLVARAAFVGLCFGLLPKFSFREWTIAAFAVILAFGLLTHGDIDAVLLALDRGAFFAAFIYLVTLLKEAAQRSRSVLALGIFLTQQPRGRRYYSTAIGAHLMGVLLNFGAVSLLAPLIQRGAQAGGNLSHDGLPKEDDERRQISALLRGFPWMILWAPTALTQAVLFTSFPEAQASKVIPLGIGASIIMIIVGRLVDRWEQKSRATPLPMAPPDLPKAALLKFGLICFSLTLTTVALSVWAGVSAAVALMLVAPMVMSIWIIAQQFPARPSGIMLKSANAYFEIFFRNVEGPARAAFVLGTAGFIGQTAAALAPVGLFAVWIEPDALPDWLFLAALPLLITVGGQLALSPIMVVVFLSAVINELPILPADPSLIVFALGAGWALSMTASPNASATLLISSVTQIAPTTLTWLWNGYYSITCYFIFTGLFAATSLPWQ